MAVKKSGLGKGLDSLIPVKIDSPVNADDNYISESAESAQSEGGSILLDINKVEPNRNQPRKNFDEEKIELLSESIKEHGLIQPVVVQKRDGYYEIIAGERRWRASKKAGLDAIPVIIKNLSEQEILELSLIENLQRENLNPIEEALAYKRLMDEFGLRQEDIAERVSKKRATVANTIRLLKLDSRVQQMLIDDTIQSSHAKAILGIEDGEEQYQTALKVTDQKMTARDVEKYIANLKKKESNKPAAQKTEKSFRLEAIYADLEEKLKNHLGAKVKIKAKDDNKGLIEIEYYSEEMLSNIIDKLQG